MALRAKEHSSMIVKYNPSKIKYKISLANEGSDFETFS